MIHQAAAPSQFSSSCHAVTAGLKLLSKVECLPGHETEAETDSEAEAGDVSPVSGAASPVWTAASAMETTQHSPPMYPSEASAAAQQQQPKVQQMTDLSNCTVNNNTSAANNNTSSQSSNSANSMANPLRIKHFAEHSDRELAELATQEISLDLQGLIDDTHFPDDNLFGDLMDTAKKNEGAGAMYGMGLGRGPGPGSGTPGSSGQNSPGSEGQNSPVGGGYPGAGAGQGAGHPGHYRNTLAYLPGSVHHGATYSQQHHHGHHPQVKQEPVDQEFSNSCSQAPTSTTTSPYNNNNNNNYNSNNTVSSSTHHTPEQMSPAPVLPFSLGGPLPSLKSFAQQPKYALGSGKKNKNPNEKGSDEYRRRRERNNIAVRKSREKAKMRTRETEDRVKILARENERLQKKVELLQEELSVLRSLFSSVGVLPDHIHRELAKHLDNFQAQHAAINY